MYTYGQVERALCQLHGIPPEQAAGKLRSRLKHFSRIGLVPSRPGKGQKLSYAPLDVVRWALCFEFAELATPPEIVKRIFVLYGKLILTTFTLPVPDNDVFFCCGARFFEEAVTGAGHGKSYNQFLNLSDVPAIFKNLDINRAIMINLTHLKRELGKALDIDWEAPRHLLGRTDWER